MTVYIPWTKEDVDYLVKEGFKDTYLAMKKNPQLRAKFQRAANAVKDKYSQTNKFERQQLIDTYYDIVNGISKKTSEEWAKHEQEYQKQVLEQEKGKEALQALPLIEKAEKSENFNDFIYHWAEFADFVDQSRSQEIYDVKDYALFRAYNEIKQNKNIRLGLENLASQKVEGGITVKEVLHSFGITNQELMQYCLNQKHNGLVSEINNVSSAMQEDFTDEKNYLENQIIKANKKTSKIPEFNPKKLEYFNFLAKELRDFYKENGIPLASAKLSDEGREIVERGHEISSVYGAKLLDILTSKDPRIISRDELIDEFRKIRNLSYRNAIGISSTELQKQMINGISEIDKKHEQKVNKFARRYLLKKQDQLYHDAEITAKDGDKIFVSQNPIVLIDNSKKYQFAKENFENMSRAYSLVLDEEKEDLQKALVNLDKGYYKACYDLREKYDVVNGTLRKRFTEQELDELSKIYYKLIGQAVLKAHESLTNNDRAQAKEYLNLAKTLKEERKKDVESLRQKSKPANLEAITARETRPVKRAESRLESIAAQEDIQEETQEDIDAKLKRAQIKMQMKEVESVYKKYSNGIVVGYSHHLTQEEAYQRADNLLNELQKKYAGEIKETQISWNEDKSKMNFSLKVKGIPVTGEAYLIGDEIVLGGELKDWRVKLLKGRIENTIRNAITETFS